MKKKNISIFSSQTGLKLVLTINPFISTQSENFESQKHLFVRERNSTAPLVPALTWFKVFTFHEYFYYVFIDNIEKFIYNL